MVGDRLTELRNKIFRACEGYDADESIRAMASALSTFIIGCTADRDAARGALDRIVAAMRQHVEEVARPPGTAKQ